ncbi:hypothetical protein SAMN00790413_03576 [Deinococcus hopiensis KR-140]|uniref:Uncharacterized protein n=1 Tax=Deinococcus hopiensis KR-140 TaxID=695939 RepID=A0A1W1UXT6_9DEIO|nr:hypothetical protein SAMN00790413_03576 [Deinococcus hopiensis KR-140]
MADEGKICWVEAGRELVGVVDVHVIHLLTLESVRGGRLRMAMCEDTLYISARVAGVEITDADRRAARDLGYYGPLPIHAPE